MPSVEETFAAEKQDEHHDEEQLVHHRAEEYGMESDPAHQMMNDYVSTFQFTQYFCRQPPL